MARIGLYLVSIERQSYLLAKTLALGGDQVFVHSELPLPTVLAGTESPGVPERRYFSWLYSDDDFRMLPSEETELPAVDLLIYEMGHLRPAQPERLSAWISKARRVAAFHTHGHDAGFYHNHRADAARLVKYGRFLPRTRRFLLRGGKTNYRLPLMWAPGAPMGYFVNPDFLRDAELRRAMFSREWPTETERPARLLFSGNPEPPVRREIVQTLTGFLSRQSNWPMLRSSKAWEQFCEARRQDEQALLWMVRGEPDDPHWEARSDSIPPQRWPAVLQSADFSICPPGYEPKTHRVIESLLRGSIPILDCPDEYDLDLQHEVNCLVVPKKNWVEVVSQALSLPSDRVAAMREAVRKCKERLLDLGRAGPRLAHKCGLNGD